MVEHQLVELNVAGPNPVTHPQKLLGEFESGQHLIKKA